LSNAYLLVATKQEVSQAKMHPNSSASFNGLQILVVDDDGDSRDLLAFLLEQSGAVVTTVASADEALAALAMSQPDVLVSDIGMPRVDGYGLLRKVRSLTPEQGGEIPAIALTAYAADYDQQQALAAGFQVHISKPVEPEALIKAIMHLVSQEIKPTDQG
jgi:CheY-like chemotaxis protein